MRLIRYLSEATVETSSADVFLDRFAPIFAWSQSVGLLYAISDKNLRDTGRHWKLYHNGKEMKIDSEVREKIYSEIPTHYFVHPDLVGI